MLGELLHQGYLIDNPFSINAWGLAQSPVIFKANHPPAIGLACDRGSGLNIQQKNRHRVPWATKLLVEFDCVHRNC